MKGDQIPAKPLWLVKVEEFQQRTGLSDYALDAAISETRSGLIRKMKSKFRKGQGHNITLLTLYKLARVIHVSPRSMVEAQSPFRIPRRTPKE